MKKAGYRFPEKVAVASEQQSGSFLEQDSTAVPKFAFRSFCPCGNLVGECLPPTLLRPRGLHIIHFRTSAKVHSLRRSSSPHATRFAGLARGPRERRARKEVNA